MTDRREEAVTVEEEEAVVVVGDEEDTRHLAMAGTVHETWVLFFSYFALPRIGAISNVLFLLVFDSILSYIHNFLNCPPFNETQIIHTHTRTHLDRLTDLALYFQQVQDEDCSNKRIKVKFTTGIADI